MSRLGPSTDSWLTLHISRNASRRLHAIMEMYNTTAFIPVEVPSFPASLQGAIMDHGHQTGLWDYLQGACRKNGFRRLRLQSVVFRENPQLLEHDTFSRRGPGLQPPFAWESGVPPTTLLAVNSSGMNLDLYEIPV